MIHLLDPIPFTIENDSHLGLSEVQGMLFSDGSNLIIEFRLADTVIGVMKTEAKQVSIPLSDVLSLRYAKKYFGLVSEITLRTRSIKSFAELPDAKLGTVVMKVRRPDRSDAEQFCLAVHEQVLRLRSARLEEGISNMLEEDDAR